MPPVSTTPAANLPPVSTTPAANFPPVPLVLLTPVANLPLVVNNAGGKLPPVSTTPAANNGNNIRLLTPESELEGKNLYIGFLYYPKVTKQNY